MGPRSHQDRIIASGKCYLCFLHLPVLFLPNFSKQLVNSYTSLEAQFPVSPLTLRHRDIPNLNMANHSGNGKGFGGQEQGSGKQPKSPLVYWVGPYENSFLCVGVPTTLAPRLSIPSVWPAVVPDNQLTIIECLFPVLKNATIAPSKQSGKKAGTTFPV